MQINFHKESKLPITRKVYSLTPLERQVVEDFIKENLEKGWIKRSRSQIAAPVFFVGKKDAGARMVIDYREINKICEPDPFLIPIMYTLLDYLKNAKKFTTLDMRAGYNNIRIKPGDE